jgi:CRISPR-associated protein (TIGR02710 family)
MMDQGGSTFLICTVGGSPEPVLAALAHWRPVRVRFVHTPQTRGEIETSIVPRAKEAELGLDPGRYDLFELPDGQDLARCVDRLRELTADVEQWVARGPGFQVLVDFTGGTKCMSAAIALQARRWPCLFSYVGGSERTRGGIGTVVTGAERVVHQANPWDALGYQAVDEFMVLFDQRAFAAAAAVASAARARVSRPDRKREMNALQQLASAFDAWDRFDHEAARTAFTDVDRAANDLRAGLGRDRADAILADLERFGTHLDRLCNGSGPSRHHVVDLLANARRRQEEGRFDDAVARLYRAIEALAQVALEEGHGIAKTGKVPLERVPEPLRSRWAPAATEGFVKVGLQDAYALLAALGDPLGRRFSEERLDGTTSVLNERNTSILAHGFRRVSQGVYERLYRAALALAGIEARDLPSFPALRSRSPAPRSG